MIWRAALLVPLQVVREQQHVPVLDEDAVHAERRANRDPVGVVAEGKQRRGEGSKANIRKGRRFLGHAGWARGDR